MTISVNIVPNTDLHLPGPVVAVLAYDGLCTFEFGIAYEVFGLPRPEMGAGWYRFAGLRHRAGPLRAAGGLTVTVDSGLDILDRGRPDRRSGLAAIDAPVPDPCLRAAGRSRTRRAHHVALLGCRRSCRFRSADGAPCDDALALRHRRSRALSRRQLSMPACSTWTRACILTAAGSAAGIDLCLHVVRGDFGTEAANSVARRLVVPPHREGGQAQFISAPVPQEREGARLGPLFEWMRDRLDEDQPISLLAERAGMSMRTFQRRFEANDGRRALGNGC